MDESIKKPIMIAVTILCLGIAGFIVYKSANKNPYEGIDANKKVWMVCETEGCGNKYEVILQDVYDYRQEHFNPDNPYSSLYPCPECDKNSGWLGTQCEKCDEIFALGAAGDSVYDDKCPKCGFSKKESLQPK